MRGVTGSGQDLVPASASKEKPSRLAHRRRQEARTRRRLVVALLLAVVVALVAGSILKVPVIDFPRRAWLWVREKAFPRGEIGGGEKESYLFQTNPQTGRPLQGGVSVLLGLTERPEGEGTGDLLYLALLTFHPDQEGLEAYLVPEALMAFDASGNPVRLRECLRREKGTDLLRSTVEKLSGTEVHYLLLCGFREAVRMAQSLDLPPVFLAEEARFRDPLSGEAQTIPAGQRIGDADRLLYYLLATDRPDPWDGYFRRVERLRDYLPRAMEALAARGDLPEDLPFGEDGLLLLPGTGSGARDASYVLSMLQAVANAAGQEVPCRGVPRVEVLNGCGVPDLGRKVGERLADMGIPLGETGKNAKVVVNGEEVNDFSHQESLIICRSADPKARAFARFLGVQLSVGDVREEPGAGAEVVVIAGKDLAS